MRLFDYEGKQEKKQIIKSWLMIICKRNGCHRVIENNKFSIQQTYKNINTYYSLIKKKLKEWQKWSLVFEKYEK